MFIITILVFIVLIGLSIFVHELGHYLACKYWGIKVEEFAIGFGPLIYSKKKWGTLFSLRLIPLGGFNKIEGEEETIKSKTSYSERPYLQKLTVLFGGAFMNVCLAVISFYLFLALNNGVWNLPDIGLKPPFGTLTKEKPMVIVSEVSKDSPLRQVNSDIKWDDFFVITKVNNEAIDSSEKLIYILSNNKEKQVDLSIKPISESDSYESIDLNKDLKQINVKVNKDGKLLIKLMPIGNINVNYTKNPLYFVGAGFFQGLNELSVTFQFLKDSIDISVKEKDIEPVSSAVSGPVGFYKAVDIMVNGKQAIISLIHLLGALNLSLGLMNILPIPALDGGHIFILSLERALRRKFNENIVGIINISFLIALVLMSVLIAVKDFKMFY